ncbi:hypothetical protein WK13_00955 [Burkholderia ubonensis]|nr:hypothetical protein WK13_00955 [Burkholderia ubonensis]
MRTAIALITAPVPQRRHRHAQPASGLMLTDALSEPHRLNLEFLRVLPSRYHVLCHALLHTDKKLSNFLLYVDSRQGHQSPVAFTQRFYLNQIAA